MSKEFVFNILVDDEDVQWKCVVHDTEVVTYEGDVECDRIPITNPEKKQGVLQIDTEIKVYDEVLPFQMENGVPYVKIEGKWTMSDTTLEDRLQARIKQVKKQAYLFFGLGIFFFAFMLVQYLITGSVGEWPAAPVMGIFCLSGAAMQMFRLKQEMEARGLTFSWRL